MKTRTESKTIALVLAAATIFWIAGCDKIGEDAFRGSDGSAPDETIAVSGDQENTVENELVIKGANFDATSNVRIFNAQTGESVVSGVGETRLVDDTEMRVAIDPSGFPSGDMDIQINKGATIVGSDKVSFIQGPRGQIGPRGLPGKDADLDPLKIDDGVGPNAGSNAVHWSQIFGMPDAFADGDDADTLYFAGDGITIDESARISLDFGTEAYQAAPGNHNHDDRYYRKDAADALLSSKANNTDVSLVNDRVLKVATIVDALNIADKADTIYVNAQLAKKADADALAAVEKTAHFNSKDIANLKSRMSESESAIAKIDYSGKADKSYVDAQLGKKADADALKAVAGLAGQNAAAIEASDARISYAETAIGDLTLSRSALSEELASASDRIETNATAIRTVEANANYTFRQHSTKISAVADAISELTATLEFTMEDYEDRFSSINYAGKADKTYVDEELAKKANATDVEEFLAKKANAADVDAALDAKANKTDMASLTEIINGYVIEFNESLAGKASISYVDEALLTKANSIAVAESLAAKADMSALAILAESVNKNASDIAAIDFSGKADKTYVDAELAKKANISDVVESLVAKANATDVAEALDAKADMSALAILAESVNKNASDIAAIDFSGKADKTYVDAELAKKANISDVVESLEMKADKTSLAILAESVSQNASDIAAIDVSGKADKTYVDAELAKKADADSVSGKADKVTLSNPNGTVNDSDNPVDWTQIKNVPAVVLTPSIQSTFIPVRNVGQNSTVAEITDGLIIIDGTDGNYSRTVTLPGGEEWVGKTIRIYNVAYYNDSYNNEKAPWYYSNAVVAVAAEGVSFLTYYNDTNYDATKYRSVWYGYTVQFTCVSANSWISDWGY